MNREGKSAAGGDETSEETHNKGNLVEKICMERDWEQKNCLYSCLFHPRGIQQSDATEMGAGIRLKVS